MSTDAGRLGLRTEPGEPAMVEAPPGLDLGGAVEWLTAVAADLGTVLDNHGAVLVRGLPFASTREFGRLRDVVIGGRAQYREKATPRTSFGDDVFSSTNLPPAQRIMLHNENSYTLAFPGIVVFGCLVAPQEGGATPVADCRRVLAGIPDHLRQRFRDAGWALVRNYSEHYSLTWQTAFDTDDREAVLRYCADNEIGAEWRPDGQLRTVQRRSALIRHPRLGDEVWFNHAAFWSEWSLDDEVREFLLDEMPRDQLPFNTMFGDGKELTARDVAALNAAYDEATVRTDWQPGDLIIVDNLLAAHGREPYRGDRTIVVAMGNVVRLSDCRPTVAPLPGFAQP